MANISGKPRSDLPITPATELSLSGRKAVVIGGTDGLGRELARQLASRGASVTVVGRTFRDEGTPGIDFLKADLSLMAEGRRIGRSLPAEALDFVFLTTGIIAAPNREVTPEGLERDMAVSYLSRLAILRELAPRMASAPREGRPRPRVYVMGFPGTGEKGNLEDLNAERSYAAMPVHMSTVAGNESLVLEFARRYPTLDFYGLNPGLIKTKIRSNYLGEGSLKHRLAEWLIGLTMISAEQYAQRMVPVLLSPSLEGRSPVMFNQKGRPIEASTTLGDGYAGRFITASEQLIDRALAST
ncbi:SDR family NAD(P)-dependent oxidoreductase [Archangium sp.]|uniref:SDR family NAD(P)-dependent oxidoreductase n=1 Tax=Archangium sp. TaxID=1872627 RepID=UPI00286CE118|nr:SDR family NAD(P)-dependent oxidoreductase [Archangium sp.]